MTELSMLSDEIGRARGVEILECLGTVLVLDLETTAFRPSGGRAVEVAVVQYRGDALLNVYTTLLHGVLEPKRLHNAVPVRELADAPPFKDVAPILKGLIERSHAILGQNVGFDVDWLKTEFARVGVECPFPPAVDLISVAKLARPGLESYNLDALAAATAVSVHRPRHRALADCMTTHDVFLIMVAELAMAGQVKSAGEIMQRFAKASRPSKSFGVPESPDEIQAVVDRVGESWAARETLSKAIEEDELLLADHAAKTGQKLVYGKKYFAGVSMYSVWDSPGRDKEVALRVRAILEKAGMWGSVADLSGYHLAKAIASGRLPESALQALSEFGALKHVRRVRVHPSR